MRSLRDRSRAPSARATAASRPTARATGWSSAAPFAARRAPRFPNGSRSSTTACARCFATHRPTASSSRICSTPETCGARSCWARARRRRAGGGAGRHAGRRVHAGGNQARGRRLRPRREARRSQQMVKLLLGLDTVPTPHDAADALAVAICHVHTRPARPIAATAARRRVICELAPREAGADWRDARRRDRPSHGHARSRKHSSASIVDVGGVGYDVHVPLSTFYGVGETGAASSCASTRTCARTHALSASPRARTGSVRAPDLRQRHRPEGARSRCCRASTPAIWCGRFARGCRAADAHSRRRQEDRRAHRARAQGPPSATTAAGGQPEGVAPGDDCADDLLSALTNLGYKGQIAEKAVDAALKKTPDGSFEDVLRDILRG